MRAVARACGPVNERRRLGFLALARAVRFAVPAELVELRRRGPFALPVDPEAIAEGRLDCGPLLPDALPLLRSEAGGALLVRFAPNGAARELVEWSPGGAWHPTDRVPSFPSPVAAELRFAERVLGAGPGRAGGRQDWRGAAAAARRASEARPDLAWPGHVLGLEALRRGDPRTAAEAFASALRGLRTTEGFTQSWSASALSLAAEMLLELEPRRLERDAFLRAAVERGSAGVRAFWIQEAERAPTGARSYELLLRAGWDWHFPQDLDRVLGALARAADDMGSQPLAALARLHLRALLRT